MFEKVKLALRITTAAFDSEIEDLISAALADLGIAGVITLEETDPLIIRAVITYCKANFGQPEEYDRLKAAYDEQKAQLQMATGYTDWGEDNG
nr:MAG TPA: head to tail adaptor [Caudoviricetes sp.]